MNSVCIATYNGEKYIAEQLQSILVQLRPDDEVIVSDDGSTDNTVAIVCGLNDPRIVVLHNNQHSLKTNFINALEHARGDVIFLSDQDDVWLPGKYERCIKELEEADLVCTNSMMTDENLRVIDDDFFSLYHSGKGILKNICVSTYYGCCMAFRRSLLKEALPMPSSQNVAHDVWLGLVAEMQGKVQFVKQPYLLYRRHTGTATQAADILHRSKRSLWEKVKTRIVILYYVCKFRIQHAR